MRTERAWELCHLHGLCGVCCCPSVLRAKEGTGETEWFCYRSVPGQGGRGNQFQDCQVGTLGEVEGQEALDSHHSFALLPC